jgi:hypothetical protein
MAMSSIVDLGDTVGVIALGIAGFVLLARLSAIAIVNEAMVNITIESVGDWAWNWDMMAVGRRLGDGVR